jgi:hypothetical protein
MNAKSTNRSRGGLFCGSGAIGFRGIGGTPFACIRYQGFLGYAEKAQRRKRVNRMRMKQQTLAIAADQGAGFEQYRRPTKRDVFLETMEHIVPCTLCRLSSRIIRRAKEVARQLVWTACCGCTLWSIGSTWSMQPARKRCWTAPHCDDSLGLTWGASACLMARHDTVDVPQTAGSQQAGRAGVRQGQRGTARA